MEFKEEGGRKILQNQKLKETYNQGQCIDPCLGPDLKKATIRETF